LVSSMTSSFIDCGETSSFLPSVQEAPRYNTHTVA
jgi:hypothetical protein